MEYFGDRLSLSEHDLELRLNFLKTRAKWHEDRVDGPELLDVASSNLHDAAAATLRRDAGAVGLLLGRIEDARVQFRYAAKRWLELGFFEGLLMLRLSGGDRDELRYAGFEQHWWIEPSLNDLETGAGSDRPAEPDRRFSRSSTRSPRQLVSLVQTGFLQESLRRATARAEERLRVYAGYPLGVTQTPVGRYLSLLTALRVGEPDAGAETLTGMTIRRNELIEVARHDQHHWRMVQKPAELIDFDLMALGIAALGRDEETFAASREIAARHGSLAELPFELASLLLQPPRELEYI